MSVGLAESQFCLSRPAWLINTWDPVQSVIRHSIAKSNFDLLLVNMAYNPRYTYIRTPKFQPDRWSHHTSQPFYDEDHYDSPLPYPGHYYDRIIPPYAHGRSGMHSQVDHAPQYLGYYDERIVSPFTPGRYRAYSQGDYGSYIQPTHLPYGINFSNFSLASFNG